MVQIFIKVDNGDSQNVEEWSIIEVQGDLTTDKGESLANKFMADLYYNNDGVPILILGHHTLFGKVATLEKPLVLLKKNIKVLKKSNQLMMFDDDEETSNDSITKPLQQQGEDEEETKTTEYLVHAIIRKKILFNKRPRPIVLNEIKKKII